MWDYPTLLISSFINFENLFRNLEFMELHWIPFFFLYQYTWQTNSRKKNYYVFFISKTFVSNNPKLNFCYLKIIHFLHPCCHPKLIWDILKNAQETSVSVLIKIAKMVWLIIMKMKLKMKSKSHRHDKNRIRSRNGYKCTIYKSCFNMMMLMCIKQHLSNI